MSHNNGNTTHLPLTIQMSHNNDTTHLPLTIQMSHNNDNTTHLPLTIQMSRSNSKKGVQLLDPPASDPTPRKAQSGRT